MWSMYNVMLVLTSPRDGPIYVIEHVEEFEILLNKHDLLELLVSFGCIKFNSLSLYSDIDP